MGSVISPDSVVPSQTESTRINTGKWAFLNKLKELGRKVPLFRGSQQGRQTSEIRKEPPQLLTIKELKAKSKIIPESGYDLLINECQGGKPENIPDPTANELVRLYPDFISLVDGSGLLDRLNNGDKDLIAEMAGELLKKFLGTEKLSVVIERLNKGQQTKPSDLKIVLVNQLGRHMRELIFKERARRIIEEQEIEGGAQDSGSASVVSGRVISQINDASPK